jgi:hypothetical protein
VPDQEFVLQTVQQRMLSLRGSCSQGGEYEAGLSSGLLAPSGVYRPDDGSKHFLKRR